MTNNFYNNNVKSQGRELKNFKMKDNDSSINFISNNNSQETIKNGIISVL